MRKNINTCNVEGLLYEQNLEIKTVQNQQSANFGKEFIRGTVSVATDDACMNVITVNYTYVTPTTKAGGVNNTFNNLKRIMETGKTVVNDGAAAAMKVKLTPSIALNDFYPEGGDELVSQQRSEGGFVSIVSTLNTDEKARKKFTADIVINQVIRVEADFEKNIEKDYLKVKGVIFDFRNAVLPIEFVVRREDAMEYFEGLEASNANKIYTQVSGEINSTTVVVTKTLESAFGGPQVETSERHAKEWEITWAKPEPYIYGEENTITDADLEKAFQDRNVHLEDVKARAKEYYASRNSQPAPSAFSSGPSPVSNIPTGKFDF